MARSATTSDVFNAIAEPRRRQIIELLAPRERSVNDVAKILCMAQPQASKHLKVLKEVGLVTVRELGQQRLYSLDGDVLKQVYDWAKAFEGLWTERFDRLDELLEELKERDRAKAPPAGDDADA
ncbi:MAG: sdpR 4 [Cyanobacteria bacterium RYN_339]|nr:sdpR 4 [Cyanobacteria bacterium RYN_339]